VGAELIGAAGTEAEAEVLAVAWDGLAALGIEGHGLRVGHIGVLLEAVRSYGLSEAASLFIVRNVPDLKRGAIDVAGLVRRAEGVGLLGVRPGLSLPGDLSSDGAESARKYIQGVLAGTASSPMGRRTPEQIVDRLMRKVGEVDSAESFREAVSLISDLVKLEGRPGDTLERLRKASSGRIDGGPALSDLEGLFEALVERGVDKSRLVLDLGLVREIAYYTGVIFQIGRPSDGEGTLCGGGRYDGLVKALGGDNVPALGFAYAVENLTDAGAISTP
jgi:histidyl-tRNA synthetase